MTAAETVFLAVHKSSILDTVFLYSVVNLSLRSNCFCSRRARCFANLDHNFVSTKPYAATIPHNIFFILEPS